MSQYVADKTSAVEIESRGQLIEWFDRAAKPRADWRIGTEYEKVAVRTADGQAAPFSGAHGIEALLRRLAEDHGWEPVEEEGRIVALKGNGSWITLEPGAQLELSGATFENVHSARDELDEHIRQIVRIGDELGLSFLGLGVQPVSRPEAIEWVPKRRYGIMGPYMQKVGSLGQRMMKQTAGVQVNFDYGSESDAVNKLRTAMGLVPILCAMFANSPICDGRETGFLSYRGFIWSDTDNARSGLLPFVFRPGTGFAHFIEWALDVPMYFIVRDGQWFDMTELTFRRFLAEGHRGQRATMADWSAHLTTLFVEVRLKSYIEIRCFDAQSPELMLAAPALVKGIFYDDDCLLAAWDLVKGWSWEERLTAYRAAPKQGLHGKLRRIPTAELAHELLSIAEAGLKRQAQLDERGNDERIYLEQLHDMVRHGRCPADIVLERWTGVWDREIPRLIEGTAYRLSCTGFAPSPSR